MNEISEKIENLTKQYMQDEELAEAQRERDRVKQEAFINELKLAAKSSMDQIHLESVRVVQRGMQAFARLCQAEQEF